jgi:hypothetical protein
METTADAIKTRFEALSPILDEQSRRRFAAAEAKSFGRGSVSLSPLHLGRFSSGPEFGMVMVPRAG